MAQKVTLWILFHKSCKLLILFSLFPQSVYFQINLFWVHRFFYLMKAAIDAFHLIYQFFLLLYSSISKMSIWLSVLIISIYCYISHSGLLFPHFVELFFCIFEVHWFSLNWFFELSGSLYSSVSLESVIGNFVFLVMLYSSDCSSFLWLCIKVCIFEEVHTYYSIWRLSLSEKAPQQSTSKPCDVVPKPRATGACMVLGHTRRLGCLWLTQHWGSL